jgi:hypothetical protein
MTIEFYNRKFRVKMQARSGCFVLEQKDGDGRFVEIHREHNPEFKTPGEVFRYAKRLAKGFKKEE